MMHNKLQVFISSTFDDLKEERQIATTSILECGHIPAGMELFTGGLEQKKIIQKWIDESDIYLLILGGRYGSIDPATNLSFTHWEYKYAIDHKPDYAVFAIVLSDSYLHLKAANYQDKKIDIFEREHVEEYNDFKNLVNQKNRYEATSFFDIKSFISRQLNYYSDNPELQNSGWIKNKTSIETLMLNHSYRQLNEKTRKQLFDFIFQGTLVSQKEISADLQDLTQKAYSRLCSFSDSFSMYYLDLTRDISITLYEQFIEIKNATSFHIFKEKGLSYTFEYSPWLFGELEMQTYKFVNVKYNSELITDNPNYVTYNYAAFKPTSNPFYFNQGVNLKVPFSDDKETHTLSYVSTYRTNYATFFSFLYVP